ncbi:MAG: 6-carboxytetrahydropterin synthase [Prevotellaceae bacterium]|jgi:6-pyruvoyltetrahydropterin/6-carboxytetrahydropterin synthase|nr:6-carboxytetrahydropterin synthase [Prevotellaceae bacterium]
MLARITKEFSFEMAHQLEGYDGQCRNIHGHSYRLFVTVCGTPTDDPVSPKCGMVMDFTDLKRIVNEHIIDKLEHALMLRSGCKVDEALRCSHTKIVRVAYQPTCENMVIEMAKILAEQLPKSVTLHSLRLHETQTSFAEWYAADNLLLQQSDKSTKF